MFYLETLSLMSLFKIVSYLKYEDIKKLLISDNLKFKLHKWCQNDIIFFDDIDDLQDIVQWKLQKFCLKTLLTYKDIMLASRMSDNIYWNVISDHVDTEYIDKIYSLRLKGNNHICYHLLEKNVLDNDFP